MVSMTCDHGIFFVCILCCMCLHGSCPCDHAGIFTGWVLLCLSDPGPFNPVCWATLHCFSLHFVTVHSLALDFSPFFSWKKYISCIMCMAAKKTQNINEPHWGCIFTNNKPHLVAGIYCTLHLIIPRFSLRHYRATSIKWSLVMTSRRQTVLWSNHTYNYMTSLLGHVVFLHQRAL